MNGSSSAIDSQTAGGSQTAGRSSTGSPRTAPAWLAWTGQAVSFLALCVFALAAVVLIIVPFVTGSHTYSVLTSSMAPAYPPGTFLVMKPVEFDQLRVGDVVTFQIESGRPDVITHRITGFTADQDGERLLLTQGDNNDVADPDPVMEIQVRGKLFYAVPCVGFAANALGNADRSTAVTFLAVALIAWGVLTMMGGVVRERRQKRERQASGTVAHEPTAGTLAHEPTAGTLAHEPTAARDAHGETPDHTPDHTPVDATQDTPNDTPNDTPDATPDATPDDAEGPASGADLRAAMSTVTPGQPAPGGR